MVLDLLSNILYPRRGSSKPYKIAKMIEGAKSDGIGTPPTGEGNLIDVDESMWMRAIENLGNWMIANRRYQSDFYMSSSDCGLSRSERS